MEEKTEEDSGRKKVLGKVEGGQLVGRISMALQRTKGLQKMEVNRSVTLAALVWREPRQWRRAKSKSDSPGLRRVAAVDRRPCWCRQYA